jgi:hypothetical protein
VCTGVTKEAATILSQLPAPLHIIAFTGFGRTGKSYSSLKLLGKSKTASEIREALAPSSSASSEAGVEFSSQSGNIPCTHGVSFPSSFLIPNRLI